MNRRLDSTSEQRKLPYATSTDDQAVQLSQDSRRSLCCCRMESPHSGSVLTKMKETPTRTSDAKGSDKPVRSQSNELSVFTELIRDAYSSGSIELAHLVLSEGITAFPRSVSLARYMDVIPNLDCNTDSVHIWAPNFNLPSILEEDPCFSGFPTVDRVHDSTLDMLHVGGPKAPLKSFD
jgi:hypothetical protein